MECYANAKSSDFFFLNSLRLPKSDFRLSFKHDEGLQMACWYWYYCWNVLASYMW